jgi:regulator of RNase E activity RraA
VIDGRLSEGDIAVVLRWAAIEHGTAGLADLLGPSVVVPAGPTAFLPDGIVICGPVLLMRRERLEAGVTVPSSYSTVRDAVLPGVVVLIHTDRSFGAAFGSGIALQAAIRGAQAMVTDGAWRDVSRLRALGLPVGSVAADPTKPLSVPLVVREREDLFGVSWSTADWFIRDPDGVVRLTPETARTTAAQIAADPSTDLARLLGLPA